MKRLVLFLVLILSQHAMSFDPDLRWKTLSTDHFEIHFAEQHKALAEKTAKIAEDVHQELTVRLNWTPSAKTQLVVTDHTDLANGYASALPFNRSVLFVKPPQAGAMDFRGWLETLITHEYTHVLHLDKGEKIPKNLRNVIGRFPLLFPNSFQPPWLIEGFATYHETSHSKMFGRGQSTLYQIMIREELANGFKSIDELNMSSSSWPLNARYLYGYYFFEFLEKSYGKEKVQAFIEEYSDNWFPYLLNTNSKRVFGKNMTTLWQAFESYLRENYTTDERWKTYSSLTSNGFFKRDIDVDESGTIWVVENDGYHNTSLTSIDRKGQSKKHLDLNLLASIDASPKNGVLIAQPEVCDEYYLFYDLYVYYPDDESFERLTECSRYIEGQWLNQNAEIIALHFDAGIFSIVKLSRKGELKETIWRSNDSRILSNIALSQNQTQLLASVQREGDSRAQIEIFDLETKQWKTVVSMAGNQVEPKWTDNDKSIRFSAEYKGSYQLFEYRFADNELKRITHSKHSLFQSEQLSNQQIVATGYTSKGYDLFWVNSEEFDASNEALISERKSIQQSSANGEEPSELSAGSLSDYSPIKSLAPKWWFPFAIGNENSLEFGAQTGGMDALENHFYVLAASVEVEKQLVNVLGSYQYAKHWDVLFQYYHDIESDGDDATSDLVSRNQLFEISYHLPLSSVLESWDFELAVSFDSEKVGVWFNDELNFVRELNDSLVGFSIAYDSASTFARSISPNDGRRVHLSLASSDVLDSDFEGSSAVLDWRELIQLHKEHVLALRLVAGSGETGSRRFQVGGSLSDAYFMRESSLIERRYALRGYPDFTEQLYGRHIRISSVEWRFPLAHIERTWMSPPVGIEEMSGRLFFDNARVYGQSPSTLAQFGDITDDYYSSVGIELLTEFRLFYYLPLSARIGFAKGNDPVIGEEQTYIHIGTSF